MPIRKIAAHGSFPKSNLFFRVPDHVTIQFFVEHDAPFDNDSARYFENKDLSAGLDALTQRFNQVMGYSCPKIPAPNGAGEDVQNYRLESILGDFLNKPSCDSQERATGVWWTPPENEETTLKAWVLENAHLGSAMNPLAVYCFFCRDVALEEEMVDVMSNAPVTVKKRRCYITTAVCEASGLGDDCHELLLLRWYRDHVLLHEPGGAATIADYYQTAPRLVAAIDRLADRATIYRQLYRDAIGPAVAAVANGDYATARRIYESMVRRLRSEFAD